MTASFGAEKSPPAVSRIRFLLRPRVNAASGPPSHKENTMAKYLLLKHYRGAPAPVNDIPMDQWTPDEVDALKSTALPQRGRDISGGTWWRTA